MWRRAEVAIVRALAQEGMRWQISAERIAIAEVGTMQIEFGEHITESLGDEIDRIERAIKEAVPAAKHVDLESD